MPDRNDPIAAGFGRRLLAAIALGFLILIVLGLVGVWSLYQAEHRNERVIHTYEVESALQEFVALTERIGTVRRGFLLSGDERFASRLEEVSGEIEALADRLEALTMDNPGQRERAAELRALSQDHVDSARASVARLRAEPGVDARAVFAEDSGVALIEAVRTLAGETIENERLLLAGRISEQNVAQRFAYGVLGIAFVLLFAVAAVTIVFARRNFAELRRSRKVLEGMNELLEGAVEVRTADLQRANAELQRFAYIVSHDLRSPLVNVMGFTSELDAATGSLRAMVERARESAPDIVSDEARLAVEEDLPEAIGFIRSSTQKMDRLINAILRLSREGRRVISPEPLDMEALMGSIVDSLQHRLGETESTVTVEGPLPQIVSDRVAVEQIFSNLVENAVKYKKADRPVHVTVRGRRVGPRILFEVEDDGRGIDEKDHERVFDLFRRSGAQDRPGEGIGLAHVRALAYRLGGSVTLESALDAGATFRLSIPETFQGNREG